MATDRIELTLSPRTAFGRHVRRLRRQGFVPVHVYGQGGEPLSLQAEERLLRRLVPRAGGNIPVSVSVEGGESNNICFIREVQRHPVSENLLHVDFMRVDVSQVVITEVPLNLVGESPAVRERGGVVIQPDNSLLVEALPLDMPEELTVSIAELMEIGEVVKISEIAVPEGARILRDDDDVVVRILAPRIEVEEEPEVVEGEEGEEGEGVEGEEGEEGEASSE